MFAHQFPYTVPPNWARLIAELARQPELQFLGRLSPMTACIALWPVVTIAHLIRTQQRALLGRPHLRVLVAGASESDARDDGRWYGILPTLLDQPSLQLQVDMVGPECNVQPLSSWNGQQGMVAPPEGFHRLPVRATSHSMPLEAYLDAHGTEGIDLAVLFHPGMQMHCSSWLDGGGLQRLVRAEVPVYATSYSEDDQAMDRLALEAYGFTNVGGAIHNAFHIPIPGGFTSMCAQCLWSIGDGAPAQVGVVAPQRMALLNAVSSAATGSIETFAPGIEQTWLIRGRADQTTLIRLPWGLVVDAETGQLFEIAIDSNVLGEPLPEDHRLDLDDVRACPQHSASMWEKLLWIGHIGVKYGMARPSDEGDVSVEEMIEAYLA
jgi:hypothetical protein